jgi:hypothetical protein
MFTSGQADAILLIVKRKKVPICIIEGLLTMNITDCDLPTFYILYSFQKVEHVLVYTDVYHGQQSIRSKNTSITNFSAVDNS